MEENAVCLMLGTEEFPIPYELFHQQAIFMIECRKMRHMAYIVFLENYTIEVHYTHISMSVNSASKIKVSSMGARDRVSYSELRTDIIEHIYHVMALIPIDPKSYNGIWNVAQSKLIYSGTKQLKEHKYFSIDELIVIVNELIKKQQKPYCCLHEYFNDKKTGWHVYLDELLPSESYQRKKVMANKYSDDIIVIARYVLNAKGKKVLEMIASYNLCNPSLDIFFRIESEYEHQSLPEMLGYMFDKFTFVGKMPKTLYFDDLCPEFGVALKNFHKICPTIQIKELPHSEFLLLEVDEQLKYDFARFSGYGHSEKKPHSECSEKRFDYLTNGELKRELGEKISNMLKSSAFESSGSKKNLFEELELFKPDFIMFSAKNKEVIIWPKSIVKLISALFEIHHQYPPRDGRNSMDLLSFDKLQGYHEHIVSVAKKYNLWFLENSTAYHYSKTAVGYAKQLSLRLSLLLQTTLQNDHIHIDSQLYSLIDQLDIWIINQLQYLSTYQSVLQEQQKCDSERDIRKPLATYIKKGLYVPPNKTLISDETLAGGPPKLCTSSKVSRDMLN